MRPVFSTERDEDGGIWLVVEHKGEKSRCAVSDVSASLIQIWGIFEYLSKVIGFDEAAADEVAGGLSDLEKRFDALATQDNDALRVFKKNLRQGYAMMKSVEQKAAAL